MKQPTFKTDIGQLLWDLHGPTHPNRLVSTSQMADILRLAPATLETMRSRGGGPEYLKVRSRVYYDLVAGIRWYEDNMEVHI